METWKICVAKNVKEQALTQWKLGIDNQDFMEFYISFVSGACDKSGLDQY